MLRAILLPALLALLVLTWETNAVSNFYFYVSDEEPICFVDEISQDATLILTYTHDEYATKPLKFVIYTRAEDSDPAVEFPITSAAAGRFAYTAKETSQHEICVEAREEEVEWRDRAKFYLKTEVLVQDLASANSGLVLANRSHVVTLQQELTTITSQVEVLLKDLQTARAREAHFRDQGERVNTFVIWLSIAQTVFVLLTAAFQSWHLHNFFRHKKIA